MRITCQPPKASSALFTHHTEEGGAVEHPSDTKLIQGFVGLYLSVGWRLIIMVVMGGRSQRFSHARENIM